MTNANEALRRIRDFPHDNTSCEQAMSQIAREALAATPAVDGGPLQDILCAIAAGYKCEGKDDRFIIVENPAFQEDDGSNPNLVIDTWLAAQPASPLLTEDPTTSDVEKLRQIAFRLSAHQQYRLAFLISENIGYSLKSDDPLAELSVGGHPLAERGGAA